MPMLVFGSWLAYIFLVLMWERWLRIPQPEWKHVLMQFTGASFYIINYYFWGAPFYYTIANAFSLSWLALYYLVYLKDLSRPPRWKLFALLLTVPYTLFYVACEMIPRIGVGNGIHEFWFMLIAYFGYVGLILWRRDAQGQWHRTTLAEAQEAR